MKRLLATLALAAAAARAPAADWASLFDRRTLAGWHVESLPADRGEELWQVRTGAITCDSLGQPDHDWPLYDETREAKRWIFPQFRDVRIRVLD
jgi:hypothetical protein